MNVEDAGLLERLADVRPASIVALVRPGRPVVEPRLTIAVVAAPPQFGVERVCDVGINCTDLLLADAGNDVLVGLAAVVDASLDA